MRGIPTRSSLRALIEAVLVDDSDINAFCLDYFPELRKQFSGSMSPVDKISKLLARAERARILGCLREYDADRVAHYEHLLHYDQLQEIVRPRRPGWLWGLVAAGVSLAVVCAGVSFWAGRHTGPRRRVAVVGFDGDREDEQALTSRLKRRHRVISQAEWDTAVGEATEPGKDEVAAVATRVGADAVVRARVEKDPESGEFVMDLEVIDVSTGRTVKVFRQLFQGWAQETEILERIDEAIVIALSDAPEVEPREEPAPIGLPLAEEARWPPNPAPGVIARPNTRQSRTGPKPASVDARGPDMIVLLDEDGDGEPVTTDCDDHDPRRYHGNPRPRNCCQCTDHASCAVNHAKRDNLSVCQPARCDTNFDYDCTGSLVPCFVDEDCDGYSPDDPDPRQRDCDDHDPRVHPGAAPSPGDPSRDWACQATMVGR